MDFPNFKRLTYRTAVYVFLKGSNVWVFLHVSWLKNKENSKFIQETIFYSKYELIILCTSDPLRIGECSSNSPILKNNGAEASKGVRPSCF